MNSTLYTIVAAAIAALLTAVAAFPFGAPLQACTTRTPHHQENHPANTSCPFEISGYGWIAGQFSPSKQVFLFDYNYGYGADH